MRLWLFLFISLLPGSLGLFPGGAAAVQNPGLTLGQEEFTRIFREMASQGAPWPQGDLVARGVNAQPATLTLSSREYTIALLNQPAARLGKNSLTVAILVAGKEEGRVRLNGDLLLYGNVVCTTRKLDRHQRLAASDLTVVRREIGSLDPAFLHHPEEAVGRQPKSSLQAGTILYRHQLDTPLLVKRGERVTIMAQSGEIMVTVPGQARDNGAAGERIRVKNLMSRKEISARVVDNSLVETEL